MTAETEPAELVEAIQLQALRLALEPGADDDLALTRAARSACDALTGATECVSSSDLGPASS